MKITSFKVDKDQPMGTLKVGSGWKYDNDRILNRKSPLEYSWVHETGVIAEGPVRALKFDVVQIGDAETLKVAFYAAKMNRDEEVKEFTVSGADNVEITDPEFTEDGVNCIKPGVITITPNGTDETYFNIEYDGEVIYQVREFTAADVLGAPLANGSFQRKSGNWVDESTSAAE
jgi:hypothetical protein